jgi:pimeloyl-ACP methyl ester carboxylesterase
MILGTAATVGGVWALRRLAHLGIVRALRAPRVPHAHVPNTFGLAPDRVRAIHVATTGGKRLAGWWVLPPPTYARPVPAVMVMHGWGSNAAMMGPVVAPLHAAGFAVLLVDARCHGHSDDETFTSMPRFAEDMASGLAWLRRQPNVDAHRLALLGHSVGAAAALLHAAHHDDVRAVVSLSAFAHPAEMMRRYMAEKKIPHTLLGWYVLRHVQQVIGVTFDEIAPLRTLAAVPCPTLLVHGIGDRTVPVEDAYRLLKTSGLARLLLVEGEHDLRDALAPHGPALVAFLRDAFGPKPDALTQADSTEAACASIDLPLGPSTPRT